jgi:hypothetical protein
MDIILYTFDKEQSWLQVTVISLWGGGGRAHGGWGVIMRFSVLETYCKIIIICRAFFFMVFIDRSIHKSKSNAISFCLCKIILHHITCIYILPCGKKKLLTNLSTQENVFCDKTTKFHVHEIKWIHRDWHICAVSVWSWSALLTIQSVLYFWFFLKMMTGFVQILRWTVMSTCM